MRTTARVEGLESVVRNVSGFQKQLFKEFGGIVLGAADIVRDEAISRAPTGDTGELKSGIISAVTWDKDKSKAFAGAGMDKAKNDVFVKFTKDGKRYYYPASIEYGHGDPKKGERPFLRIALKKKRTAVRKHIASKISALVEVVRP